MEKNICRLFHILIQILLSTGETELFIITKASKFPALIKFRGFKVLRGGRCLKEEGAYFKLREIFQMKFQNFVIFSSK